MQVAQPQLPARLVPKEQNVEFSAAREQDTRFTMGKASKNCVVAVGGKIGRPLLKQDTHRCETS
jgi:hypothetical protein